MTTQKKTANDRRGGDRSRQRRGHPVKAPKRVPWLALGAVGVVVVLAAVILVYALRRDAEISAYRVSPDNPDPSRSIPGVVAAENQNQVHVQATQRVAYDASPPFGGPHDGSWAACDGAVYPRPVRSENLVHSLEHGAVWIAYDPERVTGTALDQLRQRVTGQTYLTLSPYPGLDRAVSLQSWGRQLKLDDPADPRLDQFVRALRQNPNTHPEVGASCDALGPDGFDPTNPPPFDPSPPGEGAVPMNAPPRGQDPVPDTGGG